MRDTLSSAKDLLKRSSRLVAEGRVDAEAEQILISSYRSVTGVILSRIELFSKMGNSDSSRCPELVVQRVLDIAQQRVSGVPLQHLLGVQWFGDHEYEVSNKVLVPRPETEVLLEAIIRELDASNGVPGLGFEVGLGSGVLSIELLSRFPSLRMVASELMEGACEMARRNAEKILGFPALDRLTVLRPKAADQVLDPFDSSPARANFIVSNPPYLADEAEVDAEVLVHEPHEALFAPRDNPLYFYDQIMKNGREYLKPDGLVFLELPHERAKLILKNFQENGWRAQLECDLTGRDRVLVARL